MNYFYLNSINNFYNIKVHDIFNKYIKNNYKPLNVNINNINIILKKYNKPNNVIIYYKHGDYCIIQKIILTYLSKNNIKFKFYLFTFDFWYHDFNNFKSFRDSIKVLCFKSKNFKVFCFSKNLNQLNLFHDFDHFQFENNIIFKNIWCSYDKSFLNFNTLPISKLYITGSTNPIHYPERDVMKKLLIQKKNKYLMLRPTNNGDVHSNEYIYNKSLNMYFACFSSSVYAYKLIRNKNNTCKKGERLNTHIILLKTFEILGSGSLLVMPIKEEKYIAEIGLYNMKNCYLIDFNKDLNKQINYIFENIDLFNKIRKEGQEHARKNLNSEKMIKEIKNIIENNNEESFIINNINIDISKLIDNLNIKKNITNKKNIQGRRQRQIQRQRQKQRKK